MCLGLTPHRILGENAGWISILSETEAVVYLRLRQYSLPANEAALYGTETEAVVYLSHSP
jgi:hypothetical protein